MKQSTNTTEWMLCYVLVIDIQTIFKEVSFFENGL